MRQSRPAASSLYRLEIRLGARAATDGTADEIAAWLVEKGAGAVEEQPLARGVRLVTYGEDRDALATLGAGALSALDAAGKRAMLSIKAAPKRVARWETAWMQHLVPVTVSPTLVLSPVLSPGSGDASAGAGADPKVNVVRLLPAMAFGFGEHPTTRLAARALERACRAGARSVLDVGTGSGVLSIVAVVSGATRVTGLDVDERAVVAATANARLNGVSERCDFSSAAVERVTGAYDVVVANIDAATLATLAPVLARRLARGGSLLLTGILEEDAAEIARVYGRHGVDVTRRERESGWILLTVRARLRGSRPDASPGRQRVKRRVAATATRAPRSRGTTARKKSRKPRSR